MRRVLGKLLIYVRNGKFSSLFLKNFRIILIAILIPVWILCGIIFFYFRNAYLKEINESSLNTLKQVQVSIDANQRNIEVLGKNLGADNEVLSFVIEETDKGFTFEQAQQLNGLKSDINRMRSEYIEDISIYSSLNDYVISGDDGIMKGEYFGDSECLKKAEQYLQERSHYTWSRVKEDYGAKGEVCITTAMRVPVISRSSPDGFVILDMGSKMIEQMAKRETKGYQNFYILDKAGRVFYNQDYSEVELELAEKYSLPDNFLQMEDSKIVKTQVKGENVLVSSVYSSSTEWYYVYFTSMDNYYDRVDGLTAFVLIALIFLSVVTIIVSYCISVKVFLPLQNIIKMLEDPKEFYEMNSGKTSGNVMHSELKYITVSFLSQMHEQEKAKEELTGYVARLKQAQIALLQTQINPHFLFNTLQTLNFLAIGLTKSENEVSHGIERLSSLMQKLIGVDQNLISIGEECAYSMAYIGLEQLRYQDEFTVEWNIPKEWNDYLTVRISIQPMLENCIRHGFRNRKEGERIEVTGNLDKDRFYFRVWDNGEGKDEEWIRRTNKELADFNSIVGEHIGIRNVNQRIKLLFGKEYGLSIEVVREGFAVLMVIPAIKKES